MVEQRDGYLYEQIKHDIISRIESGIFLAGDRLPSENELSAQYSVGRNTAKHALDALVSEGYARRIQGKGTFVENAKIEQPLRGVYSLSELFKANEQESYSKIICFEPVQAPPKVRAALRLEQDEPALRICRLRYADKVPVIINDTYISYNRFSSLLKYDLEIISFYDYLFKKEHIFAARVDETLEIVPLYPDEAQLLGQKAGTPAFLLRAVSYDNGGRPFEMVKSIYRGDKFQFSISLQK